MKKFQDKCCLVTGATRGIGREIALEFARNGAHIAFTYRSSGTQADSLKAEIEELGVTCLPFQVDAADFDATDKMVIEMVESLGSIDIVINNAGVTQDNLLLRMSEDQWQTVIDTNLKSIFNTTKAALKTMLRNRKGVFVNIGSIVGITGNAGQANYAASKAGMIGFTKSVAKEVASRKIRANVIAPGFIATEMTAAIPPEELKEWTKNIPLKRAGTTSDIAKACLFLASEDASFITGQVLQIDGGMVM